MPFFTLYRDTNSSTIKRLAYDPKERVLRATFVRGEQYDYADVPNSVAGELMATGESVGSAFDKLIKKGGFAYAKAEKKVLVADLDTPEMSTEDYIAKVAQGVKA